MKNNRDQQMKWAQRHASGDRGGAPSYAPPAPQQSAPVLPPPPPGYAYAWRPDVNAYVLVPLNPAPVYQPPQPQYQQAPPPNGYHQAPTVPSRRAETCMIVKTGRDPYADFLEGVPELLPNTSSYDAMKGALSPESAQALDASAALMASESGFESFIRGIEYSSSRFSGSVGDLKK